MVNIPTSKAAKHPIITSEKHRWFSRVFFVSTAVRFMHHYVPTVLYLVMESGGFGVKSHALVPLDAPKHEPTLDLFKSRVWEMHSHFRGFSQSCRSAQSHDYCQMWRNKLSAIPASHSVPLGCVYRGTGLLIWTTGGAGFNNTRLIVAFIPLHDVWDFKDLLPFFSILGLLIAPWQNFHPSVLCWVILLTGKTDLSGIWWTDCFQLWSNFKIWDFLLFWDFKTGINSLIILNEATCLLAC